MNDSWEKLNGETVEREVNTSYKVCACALTASLLAALNHRQYMIYSFLNALNSTGSATNVLFTV